MLTEMKRQKFPWNLWTEILKTKHEADANSVDESLPKSYKCESCKRNQNLCVLRTLENMGKGYETCQNDTKKIDT